MKPDRLTENFLRSEFACKCGCGFDRIDLLLVDNLQRLRDRIKQPIAINSGCRCTKHNAKEGGKRESFHLTGKAADIRALGGMTAAQLHAEAEKSQLFNGIGKYRMFVHLDTRTYRARWNG